MSQLLEELVIGKDLIKQVESHAAECYPRECCGILIGQRDGTAWRVTRIFPAANLSVAQVPDRIQMEPRDRLRAENWAKTNGCEVIGFYHSHPDHDVYFSQTDLHHSEEFLLGQPWIEPTYAYLVVSIKDGKPADHGGFRVKNGAAEKITIP